jgi:hypothetical protein
MSMREERERIENMTDREYEDVLDDVFGNVKICGFVFSSGRALRELDPIAFDCGKADYIDSLLSDLGEEEDEEEESEEEE